MHLTQEVDFLKKTNEQTDKININKRIHETMRNKSNRNPQNSQISGDIL